MKKILILALLFPSSLFCLGQSDSKTQFDTSALYTGGTKKFNSLADNTDYSFHLINEVFVYDSAYNKTAEVDSTGFLHVYGDTINTIRAIMRSYNIKIRN